MKCRRNPQLFSAPSNTSGYNKHDGPLDRNHRSYHLWRTATQPQSHDVLGAAPDAPHARQVRPRTLLLWVFMLIPVRAAHGWQTSHFLSASLLTDCVDTVSPQCLVSIRVGSSLKTTIVDLDASAASLLLSYNRQLYQERRLVVLTILKKKPRTGERQLLIRERAPWNCNTQCPYDA